MRQNVFLFVKKIFLCVHLLPSRQTPPRHTGTPPVSYSDELSILIRFSVIFSATVFFTTLFVTRSYFSSKAMQLKVFYHFWLYFSRIHHTQSWLIFNTYSVFTFDKGSPPLKAPRTGPLGASFAGSRDFSQFSRSARQ